MTLAASVLACAVSGRSRSGLVALLCKTDPGATPAHRGISILLCEKGEGFSVSRDLPKLGYKGVETCELSFDELRVPQDHLLGGTDGQIARIFQRSIGFDAVLGGAVGLAFGLGAILLLGRQFAALGSGMVAGGGLGWIDWLLIAAIPLAGVVIAMFTARWTVLAALSRML